MNNHLNRLLLAGLAVTLAGMLSACSEPAGSDAQAATDTGIQAVQVPDTGETLARLGDGKPDLTGMWDRPYIRNITEDFDRDGMRHVGESDPLPFTEWGQQQWENHDPTNDYVGVCLPYGFPRAIVARHPMQLLQHEDYLAFLFEQNSWFTLVPIGGKGLSVDDAMGNPTWFGTSAGHWEGDTLVIETAGLNGLTKLDTVGHPLSTDMHLTQRFTRTDQNHLEYEMIINDPKTYTRPLRQQQTWVLRPEWEIMEYSCMESNLDNIKDGTINWTRPDVN